ncbi:hypothetical protein CRENBAI_019953 [Crenichthys baileyi]|uniref:Uncharacterized protein n=1 Tax=Crenichthys baileyi TaxID=28760 RepID=A0AAV9QPV4_9TELE
MAGPGWRLLRLACVTLALTANCAAVTAAQRVTAVTATTATGTERAPHSSRVAAVLAPCLVALAIVVILGLALAAAKLHERRQTEGGFSLRRLEAPGGRNPPAEQGNTSISTLAARLTSEGLTSNLLLSISLASVILLLVLILTSVGLVVALNRRATHGAYSPSRQEKDGSRVEMWSITQPPPMERLI